MALAAFLGMVDALFLSLQRNAGPIPCHITKGCNDVLTSRYSAVVGIPLSWFGLGFYVTVFSLAVFSIFETGQPAGNPLRWIFYLSGIGLMISALLLVE